MGTLEAALERKDSKVRNLLKKKVLPGEIPEEARRRKEGNHAIMCFRQSPIESRFSPFMQENSRMYITAQGSLKPN